MAQLRSGRPEAASVVWEWRGGDPQRAGKARPSAQGRARLRGTLQALVGAAVGGILYFHGPHSLSLAVLAVSTGIGISALASPLGLYAAIERGFNWLGGLLGQALTWLLLPIVFYLFFVPFGALFRRGRRDSMKRFFDADAESYWSPREARRAASASDSRTRQY